MQQRDPDHTQTSGHNGTVLYYLSRLPLTAEERAVSALPVCVHMLSLPASRTLRTRTIVKAAANMTRAPAHMHAGTWHVRGQEAGHTSTTADSLRKLSPLTAVSKRHAAPGNRWCPFSVRRLRGVAAAERPPPVGGLEITLLSPCVSARGREPLPLLIFISALPRIQSRLESP